MGAFIGLAAGNVVDAAIWGSGAVSTVGFGQSPLDALFGCGGPLGNCGSLGAAPWSENSGLGNVQDPGRFVFNWDANSQLIASRSFWDRWSAYDSAGWFLNDFLTGSGKRNREYNLSSVEQRDLMASRGFQQVNAYIQRQCSAGRTSGEFELTTSQAARNLLYDAVHSPTGVQVGGYNGTWATSGNVGKVTFTNVAGLNSFAYHVLPNSPIGFGPFRTIKQTFQITEPNPCGAR